MLGKALAHGERGAEAIPAAAVIMVANANVAGLEKSHFFPSGNLLLGGELRSSFQVDLVVHHEPLKGSEAHTIIAAGWTPRVGTFYVPVHAFFIPDVDGVHRVGLTTGITWWPANAPREICAKSAIFGRDGPENVRTTVVRQTVLAL